MTGSGVTRLQSFIGVAFAAFLRRLDPDSTARQRLSEKYLDFGVDASQVGHGAPLHRVKNRFFRPQREGNAFRAWGPSSLGHNRSRIEGAGIDHRGDLAVAHQNNKQIRDHCGFALRIEGVSKFLCVEFFEGVFDDADGAPHNHAPGCDHRAGRLLAQHGSPSLSGSPPAALQ